ncbi:MAG: hypothetical protein ACJATV_001691 [Granulosicoccus sp.]|jgi:hypothetical protein
MIIFGTRGITTTPEKGDFNCPSCTSVQHYGLKRVRRFFTLYFIPLIPLDKLGEYLECLSCKDTYKPNILNYDPVANAEAIDAEYHSAIKKVMIHMLLPDGVIDDSDVVLYTHRSNMRISIRRISMIAQILLNHLICDIACRPYPVTYRPKMPDEMDTPLTASQYARLSLHVTKIEARCPL